MTAIQVVRLSVAIAIGFTLGLFTFSLMCTIAVRTWFRVKRQFTTRFANEKGASNGEQRR